MKTMVCLSFSRAFIFVMNRRAKENTRTIMYRFGFVLLSILAVLKQSDLKNYQKYGLNPKTRNDK